MLPRPSSTRHVSDTAPSEETISTLHPQEPPVPSPMVLMDCWRHSTLGLWMYKGVHDCLYFRRADRLRETPIQYGRVMTFALTKFLLEVCGASGAVWGASEVYQWRTPANSWTLFRPLCLATAVLFGIRWGWHVKHYLEQDRTEYPPIKRHHRRLHQWTFVQLHVTLLVLQVWGAGGAIWGFGEACGLRTRENIETFRLVAGSVGVIFLIRYLILILEYCLCFAATPWASHPRVLQLVQIWERTLTPLVLEVWGSGGAVWGFSEIMGWRTPENSVRVFRPFAVTVTAVFFARWLYQVYQATCATTTVSPSRTSTNTTTAAEPDALTKDDTGGSVELPGLPTVGTMDTDLGDPTQQTPLNDLELQEQEEDV